MSSTRCKLCAAPRTAAWTFSPTDLLVPGEDRLPAVCDPCDETEHPEDWGLPPRSSLRQLPDWPVCGYCADCLIDGTNHGMRRNRRPRRGLKKIGRALLTLAEMVETWPARPTWLKRRIDLCLEGKYAWVDQQDELARWHRKHRDLGAVRRYMERTAT